jgi:hypothetical protein
MTIEYIPNKGFNFENLSFVWGQNRSEIREKLNHKHIEDDRIIEMADFFEGDTSFDIKQIRDIYQNLNNNENYFFLNYDEDNKLSDLEVHGGIDIKIKNIKLIFEIDIDNCINLLKSIDEYYTEIEDGNFLFPNLKMTIASSESMGGDGSGLSYFYASKEIEHLLEQ